MDILDEKEKSLEQVFDIDHKRKFKEVNDDFTEMISFLDFSFEKAFERREKDFMLAYRAHIETVQKDIEELKSDSNDQKYLAIKKQKIELLEKKLHKIRECALFLGDMSEMHKKQIKKLKMKVDEQESDKNFLEKQISKARDVNKKVKEDLSQATSEYDELYKQAQWFIQNSPDHHKIEELLSLLNQTDRERLLIDNQNKTQKELNEKQIMAAKIQKYGNAKLLNFMKTLWEMKINKDQFSVEIERYFFYHSLRKSNVHKLIEDQLAIEKDNQKRIEQLQEHNAQQQKQNESDLFLMFQQHINELREDLRQRRTLNQLKNVKSIKIRTDQIEIPDISSIQINQFKSQDKKKLLEKFIQDEPSTSGNDSFLNHLYQNTTQSTNVYDRILNEPIKTLMNNKSFNVSNRPNSNYKLSRLYSGQKRELNQKGSSNRLVNQTQINNNSGQLENAPQSYYSNKIPALHDKRRMTAYTQMQNADIMIRRPKSSLPYRGTRRNYNNSNTTTIMRDNNNISMINQNIRAIGKDIVRHAQNDDRIEELALIVRKRLEEWKDEDFKCKLRVIEMPNFDDMTQLETELQGYDSFMCTLGTRTKMGEEIFKRVDYTYPLEFAKLGQKIGIKHYGLLTSTGANAKSWFLYMRVKGEVENSVRALGIRDLKIYRPGLLLNRDNDARIGEKIGSWVPFLAKIESRDVAQVILEYAIQAKSTEPKDYELKTNADIKNYATDLNLNKN
ncbi:UNKNOWN [Stylonychia lemnae]|uniref:Uncharacterized protein n=1 Tax=Stylonychia lemnae TaxID=5949 RepID=A0A077ZYW6_STYLE|nr:UNKNOWN [Stylonychia lemnae]|eukprot:CDW73733.1 UNKNOWN [Stylonychia lemnae]